MSISLQGAGSVLRSEDGGSEGHKQPLSGAGDPRGRPSDSPHHQYQPQEEDEDWPDH